MATVILWVFCFGRCFVFFTSEGPLLFEFEFYPFQAEESF